ncbi:MAG: alpha/beta fold hydrolase [Atribacterota bacterium]|nr:alpha/beta fold hydrolase [Atribacterota bacterium]
MKRKGRIILKILKYIGLTLIALLIIFFAVRAVGVTINRKTPVGGINESMYVDINGTKQWINIYGENINNPVLMYLHGGPGSSTSDIDYVITRKWADVYTVVTWDQRNCGKSYDEEQNDIELTRDIFMEDGKGMTEFIRDYLSVDKITILGHSWGSIYGANLVLEYPEYYECF